MLRHVLQNMLGAAIALTFGLVGLAHAAIAPEGRLDAPKRTSDERVRLAQISIGGGGVQIGVGGFSVGPRARRKPRYDRGDNYKRPKRRGPRVRFNVRIEPRTNTRSRRRSARQIREEIRAEERAKRRRTKKRRASTKRVQKKRTRKVVKRPKRTKRPSKLIAKKPTTRRPSKRPNASSDLASRVPDKRPDGGSDNGGKRPDNCWGRKCPPPKVIPPIVVLPPVVTFPPALPGDEDYVPPRTVGPTDPGKPPAAKRPTPPRRIVRPPVRPPVAPPPRTTPPIAVANNDPFWPGQVVVQLDVGEPATTDEALGQSLNLQRLTSETNALVGRRVVTYRFTDNRTVAAVTAALLADPRVARAQPNWRYSVNQSGPGGDASLQYATAKMGLADAHAIARGRGVPVAVIDSGVDRSHPALRGALAKRFDAAWGRGKPVGSHGTAIAGIIKAQGVVKGVAPSADLMAIRAFFSEKGFDGEQSSTAIIMRSLDWAAKNGARVVNMSFAGPQDSAVEEAIEAARERGLILIAAAGNGGEKAAPAYPAAYDGVIAVTATDPEDQLYKDANRGDYVDVAAPGVDVFVLAPKKSYKHSSGTSLAAAHVSGIVALLLERNAKLTADQVRTYLVQSAQDLGKPGLDVEFGAGRIDAAKLMRAVTTSVAKRN